MSVKQASETNDKNGLAVNRLPKEPKGKKKEAKPIVLLKIDVKQILVTVQGTSPLIVNKFSAKAMKQMADKQGGLASLPKEAKVPEDCFHDAAHLMPDEKWGGKKPPRFGFPASGFKKACVSASKFTKKAFTSGFVAGAFHIDGDEGGLVELQTPQVNMRTDTVRLQSGVADLRYRPEFPVWKATLRIRYNSSVITSEQIVNLLNLAGFSVGIGEWRPERKGSNGCFEVVQG